MAEKAFGRSFEYAHAPWSRFVVVNHRPATRRYQFDSSLKSGLSVFVTHSNPLAPGMVSSAGLPLVTMSSVGRSANTTCGRARVQFFSGTALRTVAYSSPDGSEANPLGNVVAAFQP